MNQHFYDIIAEINVKENRYQELFMNTEKFRLPGKASGTFTEKIEECRLLLVYSQDADAFTDFWSKERLTDFLANSERSMKRSIRYRLRDKDGNFRWVEETITYFGEEALRGGFLCFIRDLSGDRAASASKTSSGGAGSSCDGISLCEGAPEYDANVLEMDPELAELPEKIERRRQAIGLPDADCFFANARALLDAHPDRHFYMLASDLDNYKLFNMIFGEDNGLKNLRFVAEDMKETCSNRLAVAGYFGNDYFAMLIEEKKEKTPEDVAAEVNRHIRRISKEAKGFYQSVGVYEVKDPSEDTAAMYNKAVLALSLIRNQYNRTTNIYEPEIEASAADEEKKIAAILQGIRNNEFTHYLQPVCDSVTGKIISCEALVRWNHNGRVVQPGEFIPLLEKTGYIILLDQFMWEDVFRCIRELQDKNVNILPCSLNVSRIDFRYMDVVEQFTQLIRKYRINPEYIGIEITESAYAENFNVVVSTIEQLHDMGFRIYMDDFGSGYSSLNSLSDMTIDVLKLDMKFIQGIKGGRSVYIIESVINMARLLKLSVVVEGVETGHQLSVIRNIGCNYVQGYRFYRPMPHEAFAELLLDKERIDYTGIHIHEAVQIHVGEILDRNIYSDTLLNNILGPVAFYELYEDKIRLVRFNPQYAELLSAEMDEVHTNEDFMDYIVHPAELLRLAEDADNDTLGGGETDVEYRTADGQYACLHAHAYLIHERDGVKQYYVSLRKV